MVAAIATAGEEVALAVCRLGGVAFFVPVAQLCQAVPRPEALTLMPRREGALEGVFTYQDALVPLIDIRRWVPWPEAPSVAMTQVLILREGPRLLGLSIDAVEGLTTVMPEQIVRIHQGDDEAELFHSTVMTPATSTHGAQAQGLLDVHQLMRLSKVWASAAQIDECHDLDEPHLNDAGGSEAYALLSVGGRSIGVKALHLHALQAMPVLQRLPGVHPMLVGIVRWRGHDIGVLNPLVGLRNNTDADQTGALLAVLEVGGRWVGLQVAQALSVQWLDVAQAQPASSVGLPRVDEFDGLLNLPSGESVLLINSEAMTKQCLIPQSSSSLQIDPASSRQRGEVLNEAAADEAAASGALAYLVFHARQVWAMPINLVDQVMGWPVDVAASGAGHPAQLGTCRLNGQTLPLWDVRVLLGGSATDVSAQTRVLVSRLDGHPAGLVVESLEHMLDGQGAQLMTITHPAGRSIPLIGVQHDGERKTYCLIDLPALHEASLSLRPCLQISRNAVMQMP